AAILLRESSLLSVYSQNSDEKLGIQEHTITTAYTDGPACARQLARAFEGVLSRAKRTTLRCGAVLVPELLTRRAARAVLRLASGEPCGLRGALLLLQLELDGGGVRPLERVAWDGGVEPTFELTLVFKQDGLLLGACLFARGSSRRAIKLSPAFRLVKRKLYAPGAAAVVVEC
uniref:DNA damage-inducible transcript 4-like protein n=1 Tax=Gadus morhua TaxID=8049 RepID=A0A8C5ADN2_GADMO